MRLLLAALLCLLTWPAWADILIEFETCLLAKDYDPAVGGPKFFVTSGKYAETAIRASRIASYRVFMLEDGSRDCVQILTYGGFTLFVEIVSPRHKGESSGQAIRRILKESIRDSSD